ncbi:MAG: amidase [Burkholderiaceae bacterium]
MTRITSLTAIELSTAIRLRRVSCREVMTAYLDRIDAINPRFNAIVALQPRELLLAQADERDAQLSRGEYLGWMHGMPQAIKDLSPAAGLPLTRGSPLFADQVAVQDGLMVSRIRAAGAILIGKTNTPEFGLGSQTYNPVWGVTRNPYDDSRCAGGSSGGAAAALALRLLPVADGSDMGGSLRNPAAYCNVFGFRPTQGRVPKWPEIDPYLQQFGTEGPMGRTVTDLARLLATQAGFDPRCPLALSDDPAIFAGSLERPFQGTRIGWLGDLDGYYPIESGIVELCEAALGALAGIGCVVEPTGIGFDPRRLWDCWIHLRSVLNVGALGALYADPAKRDRIKPEARWEIETGLATTAQQVSAASIVRTEWHAQVLRLFERFDYLAVPTAQVFPFDVQTHWPTQVAGRQMDTYHRWMEIVVPWTLASCPVLSVPVGFGATGLPMGMQLIGRPRADLAVLQLGHAYEQVVDWPRRPPPLAIEPSPGSGGAA